MKQLFTLISIVLVSTCSFAGVSPTGLGKNSPQLNALGSAWKMQTQSAIHPAQTTNDLMMVYGGADVSRRPTLVPHLATA